MQEDIDAALREATADFGRSASRPREVYEQLNELSHTARSADGMVTVTVDARGQVRSLALNPRVYRKLSPTELADAIMGQIRAATREVSAKTQELVEPMMPEGIAYDDVFGAGAGLESFFPSPRKP
ncbi:YbaB/EbfC family DNA-binding protein [Nonomuraea mesophila]|uniref:YbaB/EbfC family DNA-binding protein n=1 Tax=Nonomuraea mesophila TaxID=2530382 RepID=A0A4R5EEA8_9ACTN|nr:YbaB/EbfC family nucleoid-associated protein [Nonomuraea mesophila]TDE32651.1 YbaB/EbfC family DNA-binding protein [Nonomuraea mesophila]